MKKFNIFLILFLSFFCFSSVSAKTLGTIYASNSDRVEDYKGRLNLYEEFSNETSLSKFIFRGSEKFHSYFANYIESVSRYAVSDGVHISVFSKEDLNSFATGYSSVVDSKYYNECTELGCSYVFFTFGSIRYDGYWFTFEKPGILFYFDKDMKYLGCNTLENADVLKYNYWIYDISDYPDLTSLLNIFFEGNYGLESSLPDGEVVIQNLVFDGKTYNLNNKEGRNGFANWFYNLFHDDKKDLSSDDYVLLANDYLIKALISKNNNVLTFIDTVFKNENASYVPESFSSIISDNNPDGFYFVPTLDNSCTLDSDFVIYYQSDLLRYEEIYFSVLDRSYNFLGSAYVTDFNAYEMGGFTLISHDEYADFSNLNDRLFYFYKEPSAATTTFYYNPKCLSYVKADSKVDVSYGNLKFSSDLTTKLKSIESPNYWGSSKTYDPTTWEDKFNDKGYNPDTGEFNPPTDDFDVSSIISKGAEGIKGLLSSISSIMAMITTFLTGLPPEIHTVLITGFTVGVVVLILKLFL